MFWRRKEPSDFKRGNRGHLHQVVIKCKFENMLLVAEEYQSHRVLKRAD